MPEPKGSRAPLVEPLSKLVRLLLDHRRRPSTPSDLIPDPQVSQWCRPGPSQSHYCELTYAEVARVVALIHPDLDS